MTKTDPNDSEGVDEELQNDAVIEAALRKSLLFIIFLLLPVIGVLAFLNLQTTAKNVWRLKCRRPRRGRSMKRRCPRSQ